MSRGRRCWCSRRLLEMLRRASSASRASGQVFMRPFGRDGRGSVFERARDQHSVAAQVSGQGSRLGGVPVE